MRDASHVLFMFGNIRARVKGAAHCFVDVLTLCGLHFFTGSQSMVKFRVQNSRNKNQIPSTNVHATPRKGVASEH